MHYGRHNREIGHEPTQLLDAYGVLTGVGPRKGKVRLEESRSYHMIRRNTVEPVFVTLAVSLALIVGSHDAAAKGCIKGAAVGAVAGHVAGHHAVVGAVAGCAIGHHVAKKNHHPLRQPLTTPPAPPAPAPDSAASHA
jgi:hypothetical protein